MKVCSGGYRTEHNYKVNRNRECDILKRMAAPNKDQIVGPITQFMDDTLISSISRWINSAWTSDSLICISSWNITLEKMDSLDTFTGIKFLVIPDSANSICATLRSLWATIIGRIVKGFCYLTKSTGNIWNCSWSWRAALLFGWSVTFRWSRCSTFTTLCLLARRQQGGTL